MQIPRFLILATCILTTKALTVPRDNHGSKPKSYKLETVYEYPNGTWIENLAARSNGDILSTSLVPSPDLYLIDPAHPTPVLVARFPHVLSLLGIVEYEPDVFAVVGGNFSFVTGPIPGSYGVYKVDMNDFQCRDGGVVTASPHVSLIAAVPAASLLNGLVKLDKKTLLVADSLQGVVYSVDIQRGTASALLSDPLFTGVNGGAGVNGLQIHNGYLYFSSSARQIVGRIPINSDGSAKSAGTVFANVLIDDFTFLGDVIYGASNQKNTIVEISTTGVVTPIFGSLNSTLVTGPTSVRVGRGPYKKDLFVSTSGGASSPVNGYYTEGGRVQLLELEKK
jgi:hypothetical protein